MRMGSGVSFDKSWMTCILFSLSKACIGAFLVYQSWVSLRPFRVACHYSVLVAMHLG
jgi:hypothetical protein